MVNSTHFGRNRGILSCSPRTFYYIKYVLQQSTMVLLRSWPMELEPLHIGDIESNTDQNSSSSSTTNGELRRIVASCEWDEAQKATCYGWRKLWQEFLFQRQGHGGLLICPDKVIRVKDCCRMV